VPAIIQHYIPTFLQRRFGVDPESKKTKVFRLDTSSGSCRVANPRNEAAERRYYRLVDEDGKIDDSVEDLLSDVEYRGAGVIRSIVESPSASIEPQDLVSLAVFVATMKCRTPEGRADLADADVEISKLAAMQLFSDFEAVKRSMDPGASDEAVKRLRGRLLDDLKDGDIYFESTATREIGLMLAGMPAMVDWLISKADWHVLVTPSDRQFILSDAPVTHYDPTPKMPGAGAGFDSSPGAMTFIPIDPCIGLLIRPSPDELLNWRTRPIDRVLVDDLNLLIYAQAGRAIFGASQGIVTGVRRDARRNRKRLAQYARRRPRIWVSEDVDTAWSIGDSRTFRSTNRDGTILRKLHVDQAAYREARRTAHGPTNRRQPE
jgi:hypothetical protein